MKTIKSITPALLLAILFSIIFSFIGIFKHLHFQTFGWDTAIFDQQVYLVSQFKPPFSSLHGFIGLGDHFHPLLYFFGGFLYKIWSNASMLYILQSVVSSFSVIPLFLINQKLLGSTKFTSNQIVIVNSLLCSMYLMSVSFQFMVLGEYNDAPFLTLPLLFCLYFLLIKNSVYYWVSFIIVLLTKEEYCLLGIPLAIFIILEYKEYKKALFTFIVGVSSFFLLTYLIMPAISGTSEYLFFTEHNRPPKLITHFFQNPWELFILFFDSEAKRSTIIISLFSFGFLPLFSIKNLILPGFNLAIRFYDRTLLRRHEYNNQYSAGLVPALAVASTSGLITILDLIKITKINNLTFTLLITYILVIIITQNIIFHGPINSLFKREFYEFSDAQLDAHQLILQVPNNEPIAANNSLLPHLSQREEFYLLPNIGNAKYIAVDLTEGPNKFAPLASANEMGEVINTLITSKKYQIYWQKNKAILLKKI